MNDVFEIFLVNIKNIKHSNSQFYTNPDRPSKTPKNDESKQLKNRDADDSQ